MSMNAGATRRRIPAVFLWGAMAVLVWAAFTALFGGGQARADDDDPKPLSGLTSLVGAAVTDVVDPVVKTAAGAVTEVTAPVVKVTKTVVEKTATTVAKVPVVGKPASDALGAAGQTVSAVTDSVTTIVANDPVSSIVKPVTGIVRDVPAVGAALDGLGVTDLLDDSAGAVDGVVDSLVPVVDSTVPPIVDALGPQDPGEEPTVTPGVDVPQQPGGEDTPAVDPSTTAPSATASDAALDASASSAAVRSSAWTSPAPMASVAVASDSSASDAESPGDPVTGPPPAMAPASSSAGPGGSSGGVNAALHHHDLHADEAWTLAGIPADSALPPSPAGSTDVSPD
ncbi:hypothetical protein [Microbacterium sp. H1-D42]|uniref:hypothetical protein n=1 Tax=Microbacterium sp. H1-D42 TaxID=2925844 RepID=UPI001F53D41C|nr:hypothetical protein [Microbacterium sp. H1-D42]UNK70924.1 hypothetical protein MNR00_00325 [Microbacterium sp. H1-D42]